MEGVGHGDFEVADPLRAAFAHRTGLFFKALGPDPQASLKNRHDVRPVLLGEGQQVAQMIAVAVGEKDGVELRHFLEGIGTDRVGRHPRIDQRDLAGWSCD